MNLEQIEAQLNKILGDRSAKLEKLRDDLNGARMTESKAAARLKKASDDEDAQAYAKAAADQRAALDVITMYETKLASVETGQVIDQGAYAKWRKEVESHLDRVCEVSRKRLKTIAEELTTMDNELDAELNKGNTLLYKLGADLYRTSAPAVNYRPDDIKTVLDKFIYHAKREGLAD